MQIGSENFGEIYSNSQSYETSTHVSADQSNFVLPVKGEFSTTEKLRYASLWRRAIAQIIDDCFWLLGCGYMVGTLFGQTADGGLWRTCIFVCVLLAIACTYFTLCEWNFGQTIGKKIVGTKVVFWDGSKMSLRAAFIRTLLRAIDQMPLFYMVGTAVMLLSPKRQRIGDKVAKTIVVRV